MWPQRRVKEFMPRTLFALSAAFLTTACLGSTEPPAPIDYGIINIVTTPVTGGYTTAPVGLFVRGNFNLPSTRPRDLCQVIDFFPAGSVSGLTYVSAGDAIGVRISGNTATLVEKNDGSVRTYVLPVPGSTIPMTPGDTAFLTVPGASGGFPAAEIAVRTAEPFTLDPVPVGEQGAEVPLHWTAAPHPNSVMVVSLRYATSISATQNRQVYCELADDGSFTIPGDVTFEWQATGSKLRSASATRYRANLKQVGTDVLHAAAVFNVTGAVQ
jgi:hypothetical protein